MTTKPLMRVDGKPLQTNLTLSLSQRAKWADGQPISLLMHQAVANPHVISLAAGLVDPGSLPVEPARSAISRIFSDDSRVRAALQYGTTAGHAELRHQVLSHLSRLEGTDQTKLGIDADQLVLTTGSQQLLAVLADVLFDPGEICLVAAPTYFVFLGVLQGIGVRAIPIETDADGMRPEALAAELQSLEAAGELDRVKLIYLVSYFENPSGISLSVERRPRIVELARQFSRNHRLLILEDAAYRELHYDGPQLPSVWSFDESRQHVILAQTFSKSFSPGVRVGFGVLPKDLVEPICDRKGNEDFGSANLNQHLLHEVMSSGEYVAHVESVRAAYRVKRDAMLAAADGFFADIPGVEWIHPGGGLYVWMTVPDHMETGFDSRLFREAVQTDGVMYVPGELCYASTMPNRPKNRMRLSFGVQTPDGITEGMGRLSNAVRRCTAD